MGRKKWGWKGIRKGAEGEWIVFLFVVISGKRCVRGQGEAGGGAGARSTVLSTGQDDL